MKLAARLAAFACGAEPDARSAAAEEIMALSLFDWAACGMAGAGEPVSRIVRDMVLAEGGQGMAAIFGSATPAPPRAAALANGAASHALDYDDTHFGHIGHPSVAILPAVMAIARSDQGAEALWAALVGAELSIRIGQWLGRSHYQTGFHQTATAGAFGATVAAGRLLGLGTRQMQAALGLAATRAAGLKSQFGTMGKPYHAGMAASTGVEAALLAQAGFDTRGDGMDGPQGFGPTHHGEDHREAFDTLGETWQMTSISHKFHACCHGLHAMLEALAGLDGRIASDKVQGVTICTHPRWLAVCNIDEPATGLETKFSYRHTAAMALAGYDTAALESYTDTLARDPALVDLRRRVWVESDDTMPETAARVTLSLWTGFEIFAEHDLDAAITPEDRAARLRAKAHALLGHDRHADLWTATAGARSPDLGALSRLMSAGVRT